MIDNQEKFQAKKVYDIVCKTTDNIDGLLEYEKDVKEYSVSFITKGEDIPIPVTISVNEKKEVLLAYSVIPIHIPRERFVDFVRVVNEINNRLTVGYFDYAMELGHIVFRITNSIRGLEASEEFVLYILELLTSTVDYYNDLLMLIKNGDLSVEEFLSHM